VSGSTPRRSQGGSRTSTGSSSIGFWPSSGSPGTWDRDAAIRSSRAAGLFSDAEIDRLLEVAFSHPIRLIANALGPAPPRLIDRARGHGVPCAGLVAAPQHAGVARRVGGPDSPGTLPMRLMSMVGGDALMRIEEAAEGGHEGARELASYYVGQGVGLMKEAKSAGAVVQAFMEDFAEAFVALSDAVEDEVAI
jgi:hypothetical protein